MYCRVAGGLVSRAQAARSAIMPAAEGRRAGKQAGSGLMGRLEERWRRRQQGGR
jgi:hypothetical protein